MKMLTLTIEGILLKLVGHLERRIYNSAIFKHVMVKQINFLHRALKLNKRMYYLTRFGDIYIYREREIFQIFWPGAEQTF